MKLSIIVPVYNTKNQIDTCIKSIVNQIDREVEVMIINDASTDNSEEIILEYKNQYPNIKYYSKKENTGLADTRNIGIDKAKGEYIMFVDSDDYIEKDLLKNLNKYMKDNIDVIKFKLNVKYDNSSYTVDGPIFSKTDGETAFNLLAFEDVMFDSACIYLFKREFLLKNNFKFKVGTYHEDFGLVPLVILQAKSVVSTNIKGYYYIQTNNSITRNSNNEKTIKKFEDALLHYDNMLQSISKLNISKKTKQNIKIYYTNSIILKLETIRKEDRKQYIKQIRKRKMLRNIKVRNLKQMLKRIILTININWYLKIK